MIIFGASMSPFVRKALVFAAEKAIEVEHVGTRIADPSPAFRAASPFGKMPALSDGDFHLADSSAICHYLEALKPDPELIPSAPKPRGRAIWFDEFVDTILFTCAAKMFFNRLVAPRFLGRPGDLDAADKAEQEELPPILDYLEREVPPSGFLVEDRFTLADIAVASPFGNLALIGVALDGVRYPKLTAYVAAILERPTFAGLMARDLAFVERTAA